MRGKESESLNIPLAWRTISSCKKQNSDHAIFKGNFVPKSPLVWYFLRHIITDNTIINYQIMYSNVFKGCGGLVVL